MRSKSKFKFYRRINYKKMSYINKGFLKYRGFCLICKREFYITSSSKRFCYKCINKGKLRKYYKNVNRKIKL